MRSNLTSGVSSLSDALIAAAASGSEHERSRVVDALAPQARLMVAGRLCASPRQMHAVEDLAQTALGGLTESLNRLENRTVGGLKAYFSQIVAHKVADYIRGREPGAGGSGKGVSLDSTVSGLSGPGPLWQLLSASGTSPISAADRADQIVRLMNELGKLKDTHREVITLAFFDQLSTGEIARRLEVSRPAASMLLVRGLKALRRGMTGSSELG